MNKRLADRGTPDRDAPTPGAERGMGRGEELGRTGKWVGRKLVLTGVGAGADRK